MLALGATAEKLGMKGEAWAMDAGSGCDGLDFGGLGALLAGGDLERCGVEFCGTSKPRNDLPDEPFVPDDDGVDTVVTGGEAYNILAADDEWCC